MKFQLESILTEVICNRRQSRHGILWNPQ